ncbi:hypothetical protein DXG01_014810 [Tephrocybe rancida]|nr:hypothetical protein DXG01_014810 [Tephrocybe rancida]
MAPMKLAIIGGGPSAFYVASRLLSLVPQTSTGTPPLRIHMFDRLWAPHGLVRYGVAPDHPENCTHKFDAAAEDPRLRFFGNVDVGSGAAPIPHTLQLPLSSVFANYTHVVFATGCTLPTMHPSLPPSPYCVPALSLVHWYTQHPSAPPPPPLERITHVSLIGNGNVSLDVARMLLTPPHVLEKYDVPRPVLDVLSRSQVKHVSIFARRGPLEAAFTTKELRVLVNLPDAAMVPIPQPILDETPLGEPTRQQGRILQLLRKGSTNPFGTTAKTWSLEFFRSPTGLAAPAPGSGSGLARLALAHTALSADHGRAVPTGATSAVATSLVVTSLGFRADPQGPFYDPALSRMRTAPGGRVVDPGAGAALRNVYASGWAATGARGVLAATMMDAYAVADAVLSDWLPGPDVRTTPVPAGAVTAHPGEPVASADALSAPVKVVLNPTPHPEELPVEVVEGLTRGVVTEYGDWKRVDGEEVRRGAETGKERERMRWEEAKAFLGRGSP